MTVVSSTITNWAVPRIRIVARLRTRPSSNRCDGRPPSARHRVLPRSIGSWLPVTRVEIAVKAARSPEAHEAGDERDQEYLSDEHLEPGEHLAWLPAGNQ